MSSRALRIGVLLSAAWAGCGPAAEPDPRVLAAASAAQRVSGPVAIIIEPVPSRAAAGDPFPPGTEFLPPDPSQIERVRHASTVMVPPASRARLELQGYVLETVPEADGWTRITGRLHCTSVHATSWSPLPGLEFSGRIGLDLPPGAGGEIVLVVGDVGPVRLVAETADGVPLSLAVEPLQNAPGTDAPPADFWLERGDPQAAPPDVVRVRVPAVAGGRRLVGLRFGRRAPQVLARLSGYEGDARARVCAATLGGDDVVAAGARVTDVPLDRQELYGAGWYDEETGDAGRMRRTGREATLLVPSQVSGPVHLEVEATPPTGAVPAWLHVVVNGVVLVTERLAPGWRVYATGVPAGVWLAGTNEITLRVSSTAHPADRAGADRRDVGLAVTSVRVHAIR